MSIINNFEKVINDKLSARGNEAEEITKRLETLNASLKDAENRLENSALIGDEDGYSKAKQDLEKAKTSIEMNEKRISNIKTKTPLDQTEYRSWIEDVKKELNALDREDASELCKLLRQIAVLGKKNSDRKERANRLLHVWQYDVNKLADVPVRQSKQVLSHEKVAYTDFDINMYVEFIMSHEYFKYLMGNYGDK